MARVHFPVIGRLDMASRLTRGTVTIDRGAGLFSVRPYRRRRIYTLPLSTVADIVVGRLVQAEARERQAQRRKGGRR